MPISHNPINRFIYFPMVHPDGDWHLQDSLRATDLWLRSADKTTLHAWWVENPNISLATLFLHGNAGNITHRTDHAVAITQAGSSILLLEYRGYGKSDGSPSEQGLYLDATAAYYELLRRGFTPSQIILHGESLGTAVAVELATRVACAALILEAPFASLPRMAATILPVIGPIVARGYDSLARIQKVSAPLLLIHGDCDDVVPFSQGECLFRRAKQPKTFWKVERAHHNDVLDYAGSEYVLRLQSFYESIIRC